jgi:hypothetical protein
MNRFLRFVFVSALLLLAFAPPTLAQEREGPTENPDASSYLRPPAEIERILQSDKNFATLSYMSPDGDHFLIPHINELSTLDLMARETFRLAELEIRPQTDRLWHLDTYGIDGFRFYSLSGRRFIEVELPSGAFASDFTWSPDGSQMAFLAHLPTHTEAWIANASTGRTQSLSRNRVLATLGTSARGQGNGPSNMLQWTPDGSILTLMVPSGRGPEPARSPIPTGPLMRRTREKATSTPTYPNLLENPRDEDLFEHYTKSQITELRPGGRAKSLGEPGMYQSISLSPDGEHILATRIERPFSYITSYRGFPRATVVLDRDGNEVTELDYRPLTEGGGFGGNNGGGGPRAYGWLPDGSGLGYLLRAEKDEDDPSALRPDRIMRVTAPFDTDAVEILAESEDPIRSVLYSLDGNHAFAPVSKDGDGGIAHWKLDSSSPTPAPASMRPRASRTRRLIATPARLAAPTPCWTADATQTLKVLMRTPHECSAWGAPPEPALGAWTPGSPRGTKRSR